jgi:uncharacterized metal-binding protein YceD (DUF177 family)
VQPCVVTLAPVTTRIEEPVERRFRADLPEPPQGAEIEMPEDDALEPLPETLDLGRVMTEALALAIPEYPRAEGRRSRRSLHRTRTGAPDRRCGRPFAGLAGLRDKLDPKDLTTARESPLRAGNRSMFPASFEDGLDTARRTA